MPCGARMKPESRSSWAPAAAISSPCPSPSQLGFDLWLISSNGAVTRSLQGELFHQDLLPQPTALKLCRLMSDYHDYMVLTFDREGLGAIVCENHERLLRRHTALDGEKLTLYRVHQSN